jgi:hypothetical protein
MDELDEYKQPSTGGPITRKLLKCEIEDARIFFTRHLTFGLPQLQNEMLIFNITPLELDKESRGSGSFGTQIWLRIESMLNHQKSHAQ